MLAVAYASFEEHFVNGWDEPRSKVQRWLVEQDVLADLPPDDNPFGPDPALLASIGQGDSSRYTATAPIKPVDGAASDNLPAAPVNAQGR